jgi:hypothetical protein
MFNLLFFLLSDVLHAHCRSFLRALTFCRSSQYINTARIDPALLYVENSRLRIKDKKTLAVCVMTGTLTERFPSLLMVFADKCSSVGSPPSDEDAKFNLGNAEMEVRFSEEENGEDDCNSPSGADHLAVLTIPVLQTYHQHQTYPRERELQRHPPLQVAEMVLWIKMSKGNKVK